MNKAFALRAINRLSCFTVRCGSQLKQDCGDHFQTLRYLRHLLSFYETGNVMGNHKWTKLPAAGRANLHSGTKNVVEAIPILGGALISIKICWSSTLFKVMLALPEVRNSPISCLPLLHCGFAALMH